MGSGNVRPVPPPVKRSVQDRLQRFDNAAECVNHHSLTPDVTGPARKLHSGVISGDSAGGAPRAYADPVGHPPSCRCSRHATGFATKAQWCCCWSGASAAPDRVTVAPPLSPTPVERGRGLVVGLPGQPEPGGRHGHRPGGSRPRPLPTVLPTVRPAREAVEGSVGPAGMQRRRRARSAGDLGRACAPEGD